MKDKKSKKKNKKKTDKLEKKIKKQAKELKKVHKSIETMSKILLYYFDESYNNTGKLETAANILNISADEPIDVLSEPVSENDTEVSENTDKPTVIFKSIEEALKYKKLQIKEAAQPSKETDELSKVAVYLGDNYGALENIISVLRKNVHLNNYSILHFYLTDYQNHSLYVRKTKFFEMLSKAGLIKNLHSSRSSKNEPVMNFTITRDKGVHKFLTGEWLEIYAELKIKSLINKFEYANKVNLNFSVLRSVKVVDEHGKAAELDVLFLANNYIYWIECKSGSNPHNDMQLVKYSDFNKTHYFADNKAFVLLANQQISINDLAGLDRMKPTCLSDFGDVIINQVKDDMKK